MKNYFLKGILILLVIIGFGYRFREEKTSDITHNFVLNNVLYTSDISYNKYEDMVVYEDKTLEELGGMLDNIFNAPLKGYGEYIAKQALDNAVDPVVAASIILVETGCKWTCSSLVRNSYNVGGMRGRNGYMKFASLEKGIDAFIGNLSKNYYAKGLNTPELMNKIYAENPNWHQDVNYYVKLIKES